MLLTTGILQQLTTPFAIGTNTVLSVLFTLNDSGPLSSCDGIEVVTQATIDYCSTRTHTCY